MQRSRRSINDSHLSVMNQLAIQEPTAQCEERRKLGQQILIEKGHHFDSMLSRFVGNFILHYSNSTESQEVSVNYGGGVSTLFYIVVYLKKKKNVFCYQVMRLR